MVRWAGERQVNVRGTSGECQVNVKSQSELDIGGRETFLFYVLSNSMFLTQTLMFKVV